MIAAKCNNPFVSVLVVAIIAGHSLPCAADVTLIDNGKIQAQFILPDTADPKVTLAAHELNRYFHKMAGAKLPIRFRPDSNMPLIYLGAPYPRWAKESSLDSLAFDGFVVDVTADQIVLAGNTPQGTLNAAYWLLEQLGVRWYMPTELGENVPKRSRLSVPEMQLRIEPRFVCRRHHGIDRSIRGDGALWRQRIRITDHSYDVPFNRYSHNLYNIVTLEDHAQSHPEYFPLIDGERYIPPADRIKHSWQPCTSNPQVVQLAIDAADRWWQQHPEANFFSVGPTDGYGWCECEHCTALDIPGHTFRGRDVKSERYYAFVRQVALAVAKTHPDKYLSCIAYAATEPVPQDVEIPDNVLVVVTQDVGAWSDPEYRSTDEQFARAWAKAAGVFGAYNYTSQMWLLPRVYPHLMAESLRLYDELGAVAVTNESWPTWWYAGPMLYLRAKLLWDPQQDADAILDDYYSGFFGPASAPMKRLYERFEACMIKPGERRFFYGINSVPEQIALWTPQELEASLTDLAEAKQLAADEPFAARVDFVARGFALTDAILREYWQAEHVMTLAQSGSANTAELGEQMEHFAQLTARREAIMSEVMKDELLSGTYDRLLNERPRRLASWHRFLDDAAAKGRAVLDGMAQ